MAECIKCRSFNLCPWAIPPEIICSQFKPTTQTNADRIRQMTDEELAEFVTGVMCRTVKPYMEIREKVLRGDEFLDWLKSPEEVQE